MRYTDALVSLRWSGRKLAPLHVLMLPAALAGDAHASVSGSAPLSEIMKVGVILAVLSRVTAVVQRLNQWPRWAGAALALSPLVRWRSLALGLFVFD